MSWPETADKERKGEREGDDAVSEEEAAVISGSRLRGLVASFVGDGLDSVLCIANCVCF